jgi:uncharacterized protein YerC
MTKVSRRPLNLQVKNEVIREFWYALGKLNRQEVEIILKDLLSPTEIVMIAKRLEILKQLNLRYEYSHIRDNVKVTDTTIAKMSEKLQRAGGEFIKILDRLIADENRRWEDFKESRRPYWRGKMVFGR